MTSNKSETTRIDLLNAVLKKKIRTATIVSPVTALRNVKAKHHIFDLKCQLEDNDIVVVEMQASPMEGDSSKNGHINLLNRCAQGLCTVVANSVGRGENYSEIPKSYLILITTFNPLGKKCHLLVNEMIRDGYGTTFSDIFKILVFDLSSVKDILKKPLNKISHLEAWAVFLAKADDENHAETIDFICKKWEGINMANKLLHEISQNEKARSHYLAYMQATKDHQHDISIAQKEVREEMQKELKVVEKKLEAEREERQNESKVMQKKLETVQKERQKEEKVMQKKLETVQKERQKEEKVMQKKLETLQKVMQNKLEAELEEIQKKHEAELDEMRKEMQKMRKKQPPKGK
jgi:predicted transposase/invertase (TIGR01784 family)